jgi:hypothetical protein
MPRRSLFGRCLCVTLSDPVSPPELAGPLSSAEPSRCHSKPDGDKERRWLELRQVIGDSSSIKLGAELGQLWDDFETIGRYTYEADGRISKFH